MRKKKERSMSILVLGMGNVLRGDDGIGVHAMRRLADEPPEGVHFLELGTSLADSFFVLERYAHVVALDAVAGGEAPGTLYWLSREDFAGLAEQRLSLHDGDLLEALDLAALRGFRPKLAVAGMEPLRVNDWSLELSAPVRAAFPAYLDMVRTHLAELAEREGREERQERHRGAAPGPRRGR